MTTSNETDSDTNQRRLVIYVYGFQLLGLLMVFPAILGLGLNYFKRSALDRPLYTSHFAWQIRTVWWMVGWWILCGGLVLLADRLHIPSFAVAAALLFWFAMLWLMYRLLRGYIRLCRDQPMGR